jgi:hypothetical protein
MNAPTKPTGGKLAAMAVLDLLELVSSLALVSGLALALWAVCGAP